MTQDTEREALVWTICQSTLDGTLSGEFKQFKSSREFAQFIADAILAAGFRRAADVQAELDGLRAEVLTRVPAHNLFEMKQRAEAAEARLAACVEVATIAGALVEYRAFHNLEPRTPGESVLWFSLRAALSALDAGGVT